MIKEWRHKEVFRFWNKCPVTLGQELTSPFDTDETRWVFAGRAFVESIHCSEAFGGPKLYTVMVEQVIQRGHDGIILNEPLNAE